MEMKEEEGTSRTQVSKRYPSHIKEEILTWAREGRNWSQRAKELGIRHQSAYYWVASAHKKQFPHIKPLRKKTEKRATPIQVNSKIVKFVCGLYEKNPKITLVKICKRLQEELGVTAAVSTIHKYLRGMVFARSKNPCPNYKSPENNEETREYISTLLNYLKAGKEIIWLGGLVYNLHTRKSVSRLEELHIHSLAAISSSLGFLHASFKRGPHSSDDIETWIHEHLQPELLTNAVIVSDTFDKYSSSSKNPDRLRLAPLFSERLNPCETYWGKVTEELKSRILSGDIQIPFGGSTDENARLAYLENLISESMTTVMVSNSIRRDGEDICERAVRDSMTNLVEVLQLVSGLKLESS
ncbi:hypothetical protein ACTXT7_015333 [Hymenolepis weldensis]